jgi:hypothetical protein
MMDLETFLTTLHVVIDDFCQSELPPNSQNRGSKHLVARGFAQCVYLARFATRSGSLGFC